eukprot:Tamp_16182.p1 GENE.Tamp_16182~~Tamp_16182.p1  ORF type:complete len:330 (-),score=44.87 Tamp_16182:493-1452(-)
MSQAHDAVEEIWEEHDTAIHTRGRDFERSSLLSSYDDVPSANVNSPPLIDIDEPCRQPPSYCTGCSTWRLAMTPFPALVFGLVSLTYYAYVFETPDASSFELLLFNIIIVLLVASYLQCLLLDPGTVPKEWHNAVLHSPARAGYKICSKCHMYKPPRSHYDSITQRLVLNMDHFCPWVCNCVGFYNRKFFILFLFYVVLATTYFIVATLLRNGLNLQHLILNPRGMPSPAKFMAFVFDSSLAIAVLGFLAVHLKFVYYNQTTIEADDTNYDVGWRQNFESVFGSNPWLWLLPVVAGGPVGDGVHWPQRSVHDHELLELR